MDDREKLLAGLLAARRDSFAPSAGFDGRIMEAIAASGHAGRKSPAPGLRAEASKARRRQERAWLPMRKMLWVPAGLALLGAATLVVFPPETGRGWEADGRGPITRIKGGEFRMGLMVQEGKTGFRRLKDGGGLLPGNRIQALYWIADTAHLALLSLDRRGTVQCYSCGGTDARFPPGAGFPLPFALELDAAPGPELFILAASTSALDATGLKSAVQKAWREAGGELGKARRILEDGAPGIDFRAHLVRKEERI